MNWQTLVGPATLVYLATITLGGIWWASDLSTRLTAAERQVSASSTSAERLARVETVMGRIDTQIDRIEVKLDNMRERGR